MFPVSKHGRHAERATSGSPDRALPVSGSCRPAPDTVQKETPADATNIHGPPLFLARVELTFDPTRMDRTLPLTPQGFGRTHEQCTTGA
jgi:hypothetical protein